MEMLQKIAAIHFIQIKNYTNWKKSATKIKVTLKNTMQTLHVRQF